MAVQDKVKADPRRILMWAKRTRCAMCKHREAEGHILPGKEFTVSGCWLAHYEDTHGFPHDILVRYIWLSVYRLGLPGYSKLTSEA